MAKDTEKLIRQLSLISYLMAERRPVTAPEIRRDVEGYSGMNEDAFARRFYADRAELESLGIQLTIERPGDGTAEQEHYSLRSENFHLPPIAFSDEELASLQLALSLLDGEFAYAEPLRLALQQLSWGRPSPLTEPAARLVGLGVTAGVAGRDPSQRLAKVESAIFRNKTIVFEYHSLHRDVVESRKVDPYHLLFRGGQFYLLGKDHERGGLRVFRLSRIRDKVAYATKAEHDFRRPDDFDPRPYGDRADWQMSETVGTARIRVAGRIAWQVQRAHGRQGTFEALDGTPLTGDAATSSEHARVAAAAAAPGGTSGDGVPGSTAESGPPEDVVFVTDYGVERALLGWVMRIGEHAEILEPAALRDEYRTRVELVRDRHTGPFTPAPGRRVEPVEDTGADGPPTRDGVIRPERFARLVTLASILIHAGRLKERLEVKEVLSRLNVSDAELRDDINVLNVVNFGGGSYVLYAEIAADGYLDVDPEPYSDHFARPARLLPVEAKALVAAIDLIGDHFPDGTLGDVRRKVVDALGEDPLEHGLQVAHGGGDDRDLSRLISRAAHDRHLVELDYYKPNEDEFSHRTVEPYALINGREGWYVAAFDPARDDVRHFRLDRIRHAHVLEQTFERRPEVDPAAEVAGWPRTGELPASRSARVWVSPDRARWERERRTIAEELKDGALVTEVAFAGADWLVREVLTEIGDLVVLEPGDARDAVRRVAEGLLAR
ncbi:YafY family protein [Patulibacter sp.]|uniref:helix-turn-helix transcriptional regulator n=1 Tax=Patulibacter sp. TaxID=1912859 RepID=UPI00271F4C53|nr:WYL domain-containing protein [Patulibacter sp.]MDO9407122.1 WYL domain-containing protein [Patulibacter sp.]